MIRNQLFTAFFIGFVLWTTSLEAQVDTVSGEYFGPDGQAFDPTFCLDGEIMQQLLQGFGSTILVDEVSGLVLNCEARVIREELVDNSGVIDIDLKCECTDPDGGETTPDQYQGQWSVALNF